MTEPPRDLLETYDMVHVRLFLAVIDNNDPTQILDHCFKLLKPGGYLQWDEYDLQASEIVSVNERVPRDTLQAMCEAAKKVKPVEWVPSLPGAFQKRGLEIVTVHRIQEPRPQFRLWQELHLVLAEEFAIGTLDTKGPPGCGDKLRHQIQAAYEELQQGSCILRTLQVVVGKKLIS